MIFEAELHRLSEGLNLPYPERADFLNELREDLSEVYSSYLDSGMNEAEAYAATLKDFRFGPDDLSLMAKTHQSFFQKILNLVPESFQNLIEYLSGMVPLGLLCYAIEREIAVMNFIQEGGSPGMYAIILIGLYLLGLEVLSAMRIVFFRDHSNRNLNIETPNVLLGCLGLMLVATAWTIMGIYNTANAMSLNPSAMDILFTGFKESLVPVSTGLLLSAMVVLAHFATRHILHKWKAPMV
ncbi:MAG: hypothetical protein EOO45_31485 [Flavobacterium sp.]|nr:MAG: hypothetical protein EOO45_31485 [Flavobacterium sp.]